MLKLKVTITCPQCGGSGVRGGGTRSERNCEACEGGGEWENVTVELGDEAVRQLALALSEPLPRMLARQLRSQDRGV